MIQNVDCLDGLSELGDSSVDLIVTSPPYDNMRTYGDEGKFDTWDEMCAEADKRWNFDVFKPIAKECARVIKHRGVIVWIVNDAVVDGSETLTSSKQAEYFKEECGLKLYDTLIWDKPGVGPYPHPSRYIQAFEYMFVFSKGGLPKTFNPIKDVPNKTTGSFSGKKKRRMPDGSLSKEWDAEYRIEEFRKRSNVWHIKRSDMGSEVKNHPATFPMQLACDHIRSWSNPGDLVCDPFAGSGTTCAAAKILGRRHIGFEKNPKYAEFANRRCNRILI